MEAHDADLELGLLALARANGIDFGVANEPGWSTFNFEDRVVYDLRAFED